MSEYEWEEDNEEYEVFELKKWFDEFADFYELSEDEREICLNCRYLSRCLSNFKFGHVTDACYPCRKLCLLMCPQAPNCPKIPEE
ncbi:MAG: hypothetical protein ACTSXJ_08190 [Candidatus Baldrarchaeia archaeon]